jgi:hypothetical protein
LDRGGDRFGDRDCRDCTRAACSYHLKSCRVGYGRCQAVDAAAQRADYLARVGSQSYRSWPHRPARERMSVPQVTSSWRETDSKPRRNSAHLRRGSPFFRVATVGAKPFLETRNVDVKNLPGYSNFDLGSLSVGSFWIIGGYQRRADGGGVGDQRETGRRDVAGTRETAEFGAVRAARRRAGGT